MPGPYDKINQIATIPDEHEEWVSANLVRIWKLKEIRYKGPKFNSNIDWTDVNYADSMSRRILAAADFWAIIYSIMLSIGHKLFEEGVVFDLDRLKQYVQECWKLLPNGKPHPEFSGSHNSIVKFLRHPGEDKTAAEALNSFMIGPIILIWKDPGIHLFKALWLFECFYRRSLKWESIFIRWQDPFDPSYVMFSGAMIEIYIEYKDGCPEEFHANPKKRPKDSPSKRFLISTLEQKATAEVTVSDLRHRHMYRFTSDSMKAYMMDDLERMFESEWFESDECMLDSFYRMTLGFHRRGNALRSNLMLRFLRQYKGPHKNPLGEDQEKLFLEKPAEGFICDDVPF